MGLSACVGGCVRGRLCVCVNVLCLYLCDRVCVTHESRLLNDVVVEFFTFLKYISYIVYSIQNCSRLVCWKMLVEKYEMTTITKCPNLWCDIWAHDVHEFTTNVYMYVCNLMGWVGGWVAGWWTGDLKITSFFLHSDFSTRYFSRTWFDRIDFMQISNRCMKIN